MNKFYMIHDSQNKFYRNPFGAVKKGQKVKIGIELEHDAEVLLEVFKFDGTKETIFMERDNEKSSWKKNFYKAFIDTKDKLGLINYHFTIIKDGEKLFYGNNLECLGGKGQVYEDNPKTYQITVYNDFKVPEWYKEGIIYQIFVDRFCNGNKDYHINNPKHNSFIYSNWDDDPLYIRDKSGKIIKWDFYGGNLRGVIDRLSYIKSLGTTIIYFNPIFESPSCHKYDTGDYEKIDEMFGDEEDFKELCQKANKLGMKIILDGVFSHTGDDSKYFNRYGNYETIGATQSTKSPYYDWYRFYNYPDKYECWWGMENQPNVNELNETYVDYIIKSENSIIAKWMKLGASGWRLDVADELPDEFIKMVKSKMNDINKDNVLIGEVWEDASNKVSYSEKREYLFGSELDSVTNYPIRSAIISFVKGEIDANYLGKKIMNIYENYPRESFYSNMNILGNHDTERILTTFDNSIKKLKIAVAIQMLLPGVPLIYYGDEVGLTGGKDPDNRKTFPWKNQNIEIQNWYREISSIRESEEVIRKGEFRIHQVNSNVFCFERYIRDRRVLVFTNSSLDEEYFVKINDIQGNYKNFLNPYERYYFNKEGLSITLNPGQIKILMNI